MPGSTAPLHDPQPAAACNGDTAQAGPGSRPGQVARDPAEPVWLAWLVCLVPAVAAFGVAWYRIARPSFWRDEAYTIVAASRSPAQILALLSHSDAVHGAYYMGMHVVVRILGSSEASLRLPSAVATAVAAGVLAALAKRLAAVSGGRWPPVAGLVAGLLYAVAPMVTRYAQEARSYAAVAALAVTATYLLVRALEDGTRRWWAGYAAAVTATGLLNLVGLLIVPAHAVTVLAATRSRGSRRDAARDGPVPPAASGLVPPGASGAGSPGASGAGSPGGSAAVLPAASQANDPLGGRPAATTPPRARSWAVAVIIAAVLVAPVAVGGYLERAEAAWLGRPSWQAVGGLARFLAGGQSLLAPMGALAVIAACAGLVTARRYPVSTATVALPWLVLPPAMLLAAAQVHPIYDVRYLVFCLPAVALLAADGLGWLARFTARLVPRSAPAAALAWLPSLAVIVFIGTSVLAPQQALRNPWSRTDYLRKVSRIISVYARPGDAVLYITDHSRIVSQAYPAPFRKLADIALAQSPVASATLNGTEVSPAVLRSRFATVSRVWIISDNGSQLPQVLDQLDSEKLALVARMQRLASWRTRNDLLFLYARPCTAAGCVS